jgi:1-deoxyxylulose-5-phosphate synthase
VHRAIELGVTLFDTGASYSAGEAEPRLGRALKGRDVSGLTVATKAGTHHAGRGRILRDMSPEGVVASAEASLKNLGLETLPLLQLHGPAAFELTDELMAALAGLKTRGLVRALGVNSFDMSVIEAAIARPEIDVVMLDFNVLRPERIPLIARARAAGKGVLAGMALAMGHVSRKLDHVPGPRDLWYAARALARHRRELAAGAGFGFLGERSDITAAQAALAYVLGNRDVAGAVIGTTRLAHLEENLAASGMTLPGSLADRIAAAQARLV